MMHRLTASAAAYCVGKPSLWLKSSEAAKQSAKQSKMPEHEDGFASSASSCCCLKSCLLEVSTCVVVGIPLGHYSTTKLKIKKLLEC